MPKGMDFQGIYDQNEVEQLQWLFMQPRNLNLAPATYPLNPEVEHAE